MALLAQLDAVLNAALVPGANGAGAVRSGITPVNLLTNGSTTDGASFVTATVTPVANTLTLLGVGNAHTTTGEIPAISGGGITWRQVEAASAGGTVTYTAGARRLTWFYGWSSVPVAEAITITFATTHTNCFWSFVSVPGAPLKPVQQSTSNTATSTTVVSTLGALEHANNVHLYAVQHNANEATAPPAAGGWAELGDVAQASSGIGFEVAWAVTDLTADPTWTTSSQAAILSLEVQQN